MSKQPKRLGNISFEDHEDIIAATNIRQVYLDVRADGPPSVGPEAPSCSCRVTDENIAKLHGLIGLISGLGYGGARKLFEYLFSDQKKK